MVSRETKTQADGVSLRFSKGAQTSSRLSYKTFHSLGSSNTGPVLSAAMVPDVPKLGAISSDSAAQI